MVCRSARNLPPSPHYMHENVQYDAHYFRSRETSSRVTRCPKKVHFSAPTHLSGSLFMAQKCSVDCPRLREKIAKDQGAMQCDRPRYGCSVSRLYPLASAQQDLTPSSLVFQS